MWAIRFFKISVTVVLVMGMFGCAVDTPTPTVYWPPPPEQARFEWVGTYRTAADFEGKSLREKLSAEHKSGRFAGPVSVAVNTDGRILVSDLRDQKVKVLDLEQKKIYEFTKHPFRNNLGITTDQQGNVYVADGKANEVLVFNKDGLLLRKIGNKELFEKPAFLAVNEDLGRLYVSDSKAHQVVVFNLDGEFLFAFGELGESPGQLYAPQGLALDSHGSLFVADLLNARVQVFSADGEYLRHFGERGNFPQQLENPKDLAFDSEGNLYLTDSRRANFRVFSPDGVLLLELGSNQPTDHKLGFQLPFGIHVDRFDRVFITDLLLGRVTIWQYLSTAYQQRSQSQ